MNQILHGGLIALFLTTNCTYGPSLHSVLLSFLQKVQLQSGKSKSGKPNEVQASLSFKCYNCTIQTERLERELTACSA